MLLCGIHVALHIRSLKRCALGLLTMIDELPGLWQSPLLLQNRWQNNRGRNAKPNRALVMQARQSVPVPFVFASMPVFGTLQSYFINFCLWWAFEMDGDRNVPLNLSELPPARQMPPQPAKDVAKASASVRLAYPTIHRSASLCWLLS